MERRRIQITVSGAPLRYLEDLGQSERVPREEWAARGLAYVLDCELGRNGDALRVIRERDADCAV